MPDKNGIEVLKEIKKDKNLQAIKFIGLSANPELKDEDEQFDLLTDSFLSKPIDIKLLMSEIKKHLQIEWIEKERGTKQTDQQELIFPKKAVINELKEAAFLGDFSSIEQIITKINNSGDIYQPFCDKVESYSKQYKSDEIISFIEKKH
jgi:response regulator RpfG family c-di-GMP phosphodiesterase